MLAAADLVDRASSRVMKYKAGLGGRYIASGLTVQTIRRLTRTDEVTCTSTFVISLITRSVDVAFD